MTFSRWNHTERKSFIDDVARQIYSHMGPPIHTFVKAYLPDVSQTIRNRGKRAPFKKVGHMHRVARPCQLVRERINPRRKMRTPTWWTRETWRQPASWWRLRIMLNSFYPGRPTRVLDFLGKLDG